MGHLQNSAIFSIAMSQLKFKQCNFELVIYFLDNQTALLEDYCIRATTTFLPQSGWKWTRRRYLPLLLYMLPYFSPPLLGNAYNKFFCQSLSVSVLQQSSSSYLLPLAQFYSSRQHTCQLNFNHFSTHHQRQLVDQERRGSLRYTLVDALRLQMALFNSQILGLVLVQSIFLGLCGLTIYVICESTICTICFIEDSLFSLCTYFTYIGHFD